MEVRGDTIRLFINGQEADRAKHEGFTRVGGNVALGASMVGPPADGEVEVRFDDFKVYSLA